METEGEYSGYWWLPDNPTNRLPGKLIINHNEAKLEIVGHLVDSNGKPANEVFRTSGEIPVLYGTTANWECITLKDCGCDQITYARISTEHYYANKVFMGDEFIEKESIKRIYFEIDNLDAWTGRRTFQYLSGLRGNNDKSYQMEYVTPEPIVVSLPNANFHINFSLNTNSKVHPRQYIWTHCVVAELDFQDELNIKDMYEKYLYPLKLFFCLSIGQEVGIRNFKVCMNGVNRPVDLLLPIEDVNYHEVATHKMLFNLRDIEDNIFEVLNSWFENNEKMRGVFDSFHAIELTPYVEQKFSLAINAVEGYHRASYDNRVLPKSEYRAMRKRILDAVSSQDEKFVSGLLDYANEPRLRNRLKELIDNESDILLPLVDSFVVVDANRVDVFVKKVVNTRNGMTHTGQDRSDECFDSDELYDVTSFLTVLIEVYLFKTLGFSADNIKKCIGRDYRYQMLMERRGEANGSKES